MVVKMKVRVFLSERSKNKVQNMRLNIRIICTVTNYKQHVLVQITLVLVLVRVRSTSTSTRTLIVNI